MSKDNWPFFWGMLALAVGISLAGRFLSNTVRDLKSGEEIISSTGSATKPIQSDFMIWRGRLSATGATSQAAFPEIKRHVERLKAYFQKEGVKPEELVFPPIATSPMYQTRVLEGDQTINEVVGYELSQGFEIQSTDVARVTAVSRKVTDLIEEGVPLESYAPEYYFTKLAEMRIEMLGLATDDAKVRAEKMADSAGGKVGVLRSISSGVFQVTPRYSTDVSGYGMNDTTSLEKDITAVVKAAFAVEH
ncbi:MAG: SIMPL domain-containing protein [Deltaproteobacteria bacterium]|nr:SIMPL domain-containing protein [Deltaproteobacteria bacterium]